MNHDSPPPHNIEAEMASLGAVMIRPSAWSDVAAILSARDFFLPAHREVYLAIEAMIRAHQPIDPLQVGDEMSKRGALPKLEGGYAYLLKLFGSVPTAENARHYALIVREAAIKRRGIMAAAEIAALAADPTVPADDVAAALARAAQSIVAGRSGGLVRVGDVLPGVIEKIEARCDMGPHGSMSPIRTGIRAVDERTWGFVQPELVVVAGESGSGKTALVWSAADELVRKQQGVFFGANLEMTRAQLVERLIARNARVSSTHIRKGDLNKEDWSQIYRAGRDYPDLPLYIEDGVNSIGAFEAKAREARAKHPRAPFAVAFDFLQMATSKDDDDAIGKNAQEMKQVCKRLEAVGYLVSAMNKSEDPEKAPTKRSLRGSGLIDNAADVILILWNPKGTEDGEMFGLLLKNRNGATAKIAIGWRAMHYLHYDLQDAAQPQVEIAVP